MSTIRRVALCIPPCDSNNARAVHCRLPKPGLDKSPYDPSLLRSFLCLFFYPDTHSGTTRDAWKITSLKTLHSQTVWKCVQFQKKVRTEVVSGVRPRVERTHHWATVCGHLSSSLSRGATGFTTDIMSSGEVSTSEALVLQALCWVARLSDSLGFCV